MKERSSSYEAIDAYNEASRELGTIWDTLLTKTNLSIKMKSIYRKKLLLILNKLYIKLNDINEKTKEELINNKKNIRKRAIIILSILLTTFIILPFNPVLSLLPLIISLNLSFKTFNDIVNKENELSKNINEVINLIDSNNILISNISRRLSIDTSLEIGNELNVTEIDLANEVIIKYLEDKELLSMSNLTKEFVIKILQSDLKISNDNLEELLNIAYYKNKEENIKQKKLVLEDKNE